MYLQVAVVLLALRSLILVHSHERKISVPVWDAGIAATMLMLGSSLTCREGPIHRCVCDA